MALKLTIGRGDKIIMSDGCVIDFISSSAKEGGQVTLAFEAPEDIKIHAVFKDSRKQFKHLRNRNQ